MYVFKVPLVFEDILRIRKILIEQKMIIVFYNK